MPANWSADALFRLREAVDSAGISGLWCRPQSTIEFLAEPEAATLAILESPLARAGLNVRIISFSIDPPISTMAHH